MSQPEVFIVVVIILLLLMVGVSLGLWIGHGLGRTTRAALASYLRLRREAIDAMEAEQNKLLRVAIDVDARRGELDLLEQQFFGV